ncbi:MAG TPA: cytochrome C [Gammaproteobacteria bacterium]|nr:cytochrome C [Gammaproteobacteria bacterium]
MGNKDDATPRGRTRLVGSAAPGRSGRIRPWVVAVALTAGVCGSAYGQAPDLQRGQALYENHCQACHETWVHQRLRHVHSLQALEQRVRSWQIHAGLAWTAEDIADVTAYLNKTFYHLPPPAPDRR